MLTFDSISTNDNFRADHEMATRHYGGRVLVACDAVDCGKPLAQRHLQENRRDPGPLTYRRLHGGRH